VLGLPSVERIRSSESIRCVRDETTKESLSVEVKRFIDSTGLISDMDRAVLIDAKGRAPGNHRTVST
jgi:hypothetical protein